LFTTDGGATWTAGATDPFAADDEIISCCMFPVQRATVVNPLYRAMVVRDNSSAGGGALDVAYSDDFGATWTSVIVGAAADVASWNGALFALDERNVFLTWSNAAGAVGYIAKSTDGGLTWTTVATALGDAMNCIRFVDEEHGIAVGDTEEIQITHDGGATWAAPTGLPGKAAVDILSCDILDSNRMWVAFEDGDLYYTDDGGATWNERVFSMPAGITTTAYSINDLKFYDDYCGYFVFDFVGAGAAVKTALYRTVNGGRSWEIYTPTESAFSWNALWPCGYNECFMVGDASGGAGMIHKAAMA